MITATEYYNATRVDPDVECRFFSRLKMRNGTFKLTHPSRFREIEAMIAPALASRAKDIVNVLDVGASIGTTTLELAEFLRELGAEPKEVIATDLFIEAHIANIAPGVRVMSDPTGHPLQFDVGGRPVRAWTRRMDYFTGAAAALWLARNVARRAMQKALARGATRAVKMQCQALNGHKTVRLVENDLFKLTDEFVGRFDLIRAANILNRGYFSEAVLRKGIDVLRAYCRPAGFLLVARSNGKSRHGTLFQLDKDGEFVVRQRIGDGSEVEALVIERRKVADGLADAA